jgi:hypothetical protein
VAGVGDWGGEWKNSNSPTLLNAKLERWTILQSLRFTSKFRSN